MNIGFIGLGIMGSPMAANLQKQGHTLSLYNRSPEKARDLLAAGAVWADSPAALAAQADVIITMLAHPEAVTETASGQDGFLDTMPAGALWIDSSTTHPSFSRHMAQTATSRGLRFLDAPVAGSKLQAQAAQLVFFVGGDAADMQEATPLFETMGSRALHVGEHGAGTALKMVVNTLLATTMASFAESMVLGERLGLSQSLLLTVLLGAAVTPPFVTSKREKLERDLYEPEFPLRWMHKDLQMVATAAREHGLDMPLAARAERLYGEAVQQSLGEEDFSAIYRHVKAIAVSR